METPQEKVVRLLLAWLQKYIPLARKNKESLEASGVPFVVNYLEVILFTVELTWKSICSFSGLMSLKEYCSSKPPGVCVHRQSEIGLYLEAL